MSLVHNIAVLGVATLQFLHQMGTPMVRQRNGKMSSGDCSSTTRLVLLLWCCLDALHCIALNCIVLRCIALHCTALHCIVLHCIVLCCVVLCCIASQCFVFYLYLMDLSYRINLSIISGRDLGSLY